MTGWLRGVAGYPGSCVIPIALIDGTIIVVVVVLLGFLGVALAISGRGSGIDLHGGSGQEEGPGSDGGGGSDGSEES